MIASAHKATEIHDENAQIQNPVKRSGKAGLGGAKGLGEKLRSNTQGSQRKALGNISNLQIPSKNDNIDKGKPSKSIAKDSISLVVTKSVGKETEDYDVSEMICTGLSGNKEDYIDAILKKGDAAVARRSLKKKRHDSSLSAEDIEEEIKMIVAKSEQEYRDALNEILADEDVQPEVAVPPFPLLDMSADYFSSDDA